MFYGLLYLSGFVCLLYFICVAVLTQLNSKFHLIWIAFAFILTALGKVSYMREAGTIHISSLVWSMIWIVIGSLLLFWGAMVFLIAGNGYRTPAPNADYLVVLGAQVKGKKPSLALLARVEAALAYFRNNPQMIIIASGAQGSGEDISEAQCMCQWLCAHGISKDRIILEENSVNTDENIAFSLALMEEKDAEVVIVTNYFHIYRSVAIAKKQGLRHVSGLGTENNIIMLPTYYLREAMAVVYYKLKGRI